MLSKRHLKNCVGDATFIAARRYQCQTWTAGGNAAYCYRFNTRPNGLSIYAGVDHFQEVSFVFDNTEGYGYDVTPNPFGGVPESYYQLAKLMSSSWASFINSLDPNTFRADDTATPLWPVYDNNNPRDIVWDANVTGLAWVEADTFRADGINAILSLNHAFRR